MSDQLRHLLREEAEYVDVPAPQIDVILGSGRRLRRGRRTRGLVAVAASVAVVAAGLVGVTRLLADDSRSTAPDPAGVPSSPSTPAAGALTVSGSSVGSQPFGTKAEEVVAAVTARFGDPDVDLGPQRYFRIPGSAGWFEDPDDPLSPQWRYPVTSVTCWGRLCLTFGGDEADAVQLRGWALGQYQLWSQPDELTDPRSPDVRLAGSGIGLGDSWQRLHAAYPGTVVRGAEGASLAIDKTPWAGISDGVAGWRLSGLWDSSNPAKVPPGAVVTRLSGGEGPEPGCC